MASFLYDDFKSNMMDTTSIVDLTGESNVTCSMTSTVTYTPASTHSFENPSLVKYSGNDLEDIVMTTTTVTLTAAGIVAFDAVDTLFTTVSLNTNTVSGLVIWWDTATDTTSPLVAYIDGFTAVTPNGGDITVTWDSGNNRIFSL